MSRWFFMIVLCCLAVPIWAAVDITDLPETLDTRYDLTWTMTAQAAPSTPLLLALESTGTAAGYQLKIDKDHVEWSQNGTRLLSAPLAWVAGAHAVTVKRRPGAIVLLLDHRLVCYAPLLTSGKGTLVFRQVPASLTVTNARYRKVEPPLLGDDFMRPEVLRQVPAGNTGWIEDDIWKVAFYRKDNPGADPTDPGTKASMPNPWMLSLYPTVENTTNGFWFLYRGPTPSWVVARDTKAYPSWDRYYMQAAVRPEFDSTVGVIAAYQDNQNYLLFRWSQHDAAAAARAELVAVVNGQQKVLASSPRGFDPSQWYTIRINLGWRRVQALVDGVVLMEADNPGAIEGRVGLFAQGAEHPRRPKLDDVTASMYTKSDSADAARQTSCIMFDDVHVGEWVAVDDALTDTPYALDLHGKWNVKDGEARSPTGGRILTGGSDWSRYTASMRAQIKTGGSLAVLFHMNDAQTGYAWVLTTKGQKLQPLKEDKWLPEVLSSPVVMRPGEPAVLRVEADGPYVKLFFNSQQVMEYYDRTRTCGRCGVMTGDSSTVVRDFSMAKMDPKRRNLLEVNKIFATDKWLATWTTPEADWYPVVMPANLMTPAGFDFGRAGPAAPLPTNVPGMYWYKGGLYGDFRISFTIGPDVLSGQQIFLSPNAETEHGYCVQLDMKDGKGAAQLTREGKVVGVAAFPVSEKTQLVLERHGACIVLLAQKLDTAETVGEPAVLETTQVLTFHDAFPLKAEKLGVNVIPAKPAKDAPPMAGPPSAKLAAADLLVESDRVQDTFEESPVGWVIESGVWAVMARYSCQPKWNWFGGFGRGTPAIWCKNRLDGDQNVEAYMGVKMQYDDMPEEYQKRYRDLNMTICADGSHLNSGYTVIRAGRPNGQPTTMLLRKGVVVKSSTAQEHLLPPQNTGHRQWFATRIEKRTSETVVDGKKISKAEIKVYLDNHLAMSYVDDDPISGGYMALWTLDNGMMVGRINYSAEKMTVGSPRAAAPLAVQSELAPLPVAKVSLNDTPLAISSFETGLDGWRERPGLSGRLVRERTNDPAQGPNTYLKVVNTFPAGDLSVAGPDVTTNLAVTPTLQFDYCFDPGVQINLYVHKGDTYYEIVLTGKEAQEPKVFTSGKMPAVADGAWHHLSVNVGQLISDAILKQSGQKPANLEIGEIVFADWSARPEIRAYGFGANPGGKCICLDNVVFLPEITGPAKITWEKVDGVKGWKLARDTQAVAPGAIDAGGLSYSAEAQARATTFHLQGILDNGTPSGALHIPLPSIK